MYEGGFYGLSLLGDYTTLRKKVLILLCWLLRLNGGHYEKLVVCFQSPQHTRKEKWDIRIHTTGKSSLLFKCSCDPFQVLILTDS